MKSSAKIHLVCQIGLGKPLWARVFKVCCCNSDYCVRYCDYDGFAFIHGLIDVATVITASGIVTFQSASHSPRQNALQQRLLRAVL